MISPVEAAVPAATILGSQATRLPLQITAGELANEAVGEAVSFPYNANPIASSYGRGGGVGRGLGVGLGLGGTVTVGVAVAVAKKLAQQGRIKQNDVTVVAITGNGLKTLEALDMAPPQVIEPKLAAFEEVFGGAYHVA